MHDKDTRAAAWLTILDEQVRTDEKYSGVPASEWRVGGRATKTNPDRETLEFWTEEGLRQVESYIEWYERSGWTFATMPDGKPGIEWEAEVWFGGAPVRLIVDAIYDVGGDWVVVDYKTGSRTPAGVMQLALYASAIERIYGKRPKWGAFYMTRKAELSPLTDLANWSMEFFDYEFGAMNASLDTGYFAPHVGDHCGYCGFAEYCVAVNGAKAALYPLATPKEIR